MGEKAMLWGVAVCAGKGDCPSVVPRVVTVVVVVATMLILL
jgi:hypothetical protein